LVLEKNLANELFIDMYSDIAGLEITRSGKQRAQIIKLMAQRLFKETGKDEYNYVIMKCNEKIDLG